MAESSCFLCGEDASIVHFEDSHRTHGAQGRFSVVQCQSCGALYLSPRPDNTELAQYYPADYAPYALPRSTSPPARESVERGVAKLVQAIISRVPDPGRALDVGCATGDFLLRLKDEGWQVWGAEINPEAAAYARDRLGGQVSEGDFAKTEFEGHFSLVTFWDTLEHLPDPRGALAKAWQITRPGAWLVFSVPNLDSIEARVFGRYWAGWDIPRHLWWLSTPFLHRLLDETGWAAQEFVCLRGRQWLLAESVRLWLEASPLPNALQRAMLAAVRSWPAKALLWPYFAVVERLRRGSILAVFAKRKD